MAQFSQPTFQSEVAKSLGDMATVVIEAGERLPQGPKLSWISPLTLNSMVSRYMATCQTLEGNSQRGQISAHIHLTSLTVLQRHRPKGILKCFVGFTELSNAHTVFWKFRR